MGTPPLWPLALLFAALFVALYLLRLGLRARREPIPPACRRCGYDVSGRPAGVEVCSECGADLSAPRAIRTTRRRANWWLLIPAALASLILGVGLIGWVTSFPYHAWYLANAPLSWIIRDAQRHRDASGDAYRQAWHERDPQSTAFFDELLAMQADPTLTNVNSWQMWLTRPPEVGGPPAAQRERYIAQAIGRPLTARIRTPLRVGDPLHVTLNSPSRGAVAGPVKMVLAGRLDGAPVIDESRHWGVGALSETSTFDLARDEYGDATPGHHQLNLIIGRMSCAAEYPYPRVGERYDVAVSLDLDVLPSGTPIGSPIIDESKADEVAKAADVHVYHWHDGRAFACVRLLPAGVDRAFSVHAVIDGAEKRIGGVAAKANADPQGGDPTMYVPISVERAKATDRLTLVLVGEGEPLVETADQERYWAGRVTYADVPLEAFDNYSATMINNPRPTTLPYRVEAGRATASAPATRATTRR